MTDYPGLPGSPTLLEIGQRPRYGTGQSFHTKFGETVDTGVPEADAWLQNWQMQNLGRRIEHGDKDLINEIARHINGRPMFNFAVPTPLEVDPSARPRVRDIAWNPQKAIEQGFEGSTLGALSRWLSMDNTIRFQSDPNYDPWKDPLIKDSEFKDRHELFEFSGSQQESQRIIDHMRRHEKRASQLDAMTGFTGIFEMAGSTLGDPLTFTPATLGVRSIRLAERAAALARPESIATGLLPLAWGGVRDAVRSGTIQAGIALADAGLHKQLDPSTSDGSIMDIVALPAQIGAGIGLVTGLKARAATQRFGQERMAGNAQFMSGTRSAARPLGTAGEGPAAPGVLNDFEREYWERREKRFPDSRVHIDGEVKGWAGGNAIFETHEGITVKIPMKEIDIASENGTRGIIVSIRHAVLNPELLGSAMRIDGEFYGGALPRVWKQGANVVAPGALHTDYAAMRSREFAESAVGKAHGFVDEGPPPLPGIIAKTEPGHDPRGEFRMSTTDGGLMIANRFAVGTRITADDGGEFIVTKSKSRGQELTYFKRSKYPTDVERAGDRLVDKDFKPGTLKYAPDMSVKPPPPTTTSEHLSQTKGIVEVRPKDVFHQAEARQRAYVLMPDGRMFEISEDFTKAKLGIGDDNTLGEHHSFFVPFGDLQGHAVTLTRFGDELAGDVPIGGRTVQQLRTLRRLEASWVREGKGDKLALGMKEPDAVASARQSRPAAAATDRTASKAGGLDPLQEATADIDIAKGEGGLSAQAPRSMSGIGGAIRRRAILAGNRLVATGFGIENWGLDIISRSASSPFTVHQQAIEDIASSGGRVRVKNTAAGGHEPTALPVEIVIKVQWDKQTYDLMRGVRDAWYEHRNGVAHPNPSELQRIGYELYQTGKDWLFTSGTKGMPFEQFRRRIGDALINGDTDLVSDVASPLVNREARKIRSLLERVKQEGMDVGLFKQAHEEQLLARQNTLDALRKAKAPAAEIAKAEQDVLNVERLLNDVLAGGPKVNTARSYRPRVWLVDQLMDREREFKNIVNNWLYNTQPQLSLPERIKIVDDIHETLIRDTPGYARKDVDQLFKDLSDPASAKGRTFQIPDMLVKDFLENDVDSLIRGHTRQMGTAIEMHRRFGSTGLEETVDELKAEAKLLIRNAPTNEIARKLAQRRDQDIEDLLATRDRLYGVYGVPENPHQWSSRAVRMAKQYSNLTLLGMSGVTAMGDLVRPLMTEGLQAVHDYGFRTLASQSRSTILKMSREQIEFAADGMELIRNTRALSQSDAGDVFRSRTPFERGLAKANSWFFVMNGLNMVNQIDKEWAGVIIQGNMNKTLAALVSGGRVDPVLVQRLAVNSIDDAMAGRIMREMNRTGGSNRFGKLTLADTASWTDEEAAKTYRVALNQMLNRTVPTPTLADTPNWFSSEIGGLMTQYKSFVMGAMNRGVISGLQEEGAKYWLGAAGAVGFSMILNELRSRLFYDRSTFDKPMTAVIMDAVDRSSILGWFSDANKAIEVLTGHRAGIRPFIGADRPRSEEGSRIIGTAAGPFAGQAVNALGVLGDIMSGNPTVRTMADARQLIPGQSVPYMDPVMDRFISDGSRFEKREPKGRKRKGEVNRPDAPLTLGP